MSELVLVTGGGGFLGMAIVRQLLDASFRVRTYSRQTYPQLAAWGVEQYRGDLADYEALSAAFAGVDAVIHAAAKAGIAGPYAEYYQANTLGTELVIKACRAHRIKKLVYTSSPSVAFAGVDQDGVDESAPYPRHFLAHYPQTKALGEQAVLAANSSELRTVALRPHLIWGPGDPHLLPRLVAKAQSGRLRLIGAGTKLVDAVYVDNAATAHLLALAALKPHSPAAGRAYYISNDEPWPMRDLINGMLQAAGVAPITKSVSPGLGYALGACMEMFYSLFPIQGEPPLTRFAASQLATSHWYNIAAAKCDLGYHPTVSMCTGMERLAQHRQQSALSRLL